MPRLPFPRSNIAPTVAIITVSALAFLLAVSALSQAQGQEALQAALKQGGVVAAQERAGLYRKLQKHAAVLEAQAAVVKTVAKLIGPTVVHI